MMGLRKAREQNVSKVVDLKTLPKVPKDPRMLANNGGVPIGRNKNGGRPGAPSSLTWTAGSKTKMTDGKSVLTRARREAKEISAMSKLTKPTHELRGRISQVTRAPAGMVKEYKTATQPAVKILSRRTNIVRKTDAGISKPSLEDREKRLRALTSGGAGSKRDALGAVKETLVGSSDEGEDDEDLGDLFDDAPKPQSRPPKPLSSASASRPGPSSPLSSSLASSSKASPSGSSRPQPASRAVTEPRPSELISSLISKPKPAPKARPRPTDRSSPAVGSSPPKPDSRSGSPMAGAPKRPMMVPRKEVDIFNRGSKKPRVR
jgi:elongin-A